MRIPRVRFTIRRMMVAVVIVALLLGGVVWMARRSNQFRDLADEHQSLANLGMARSSEHVEQRTPSGWHHFRMARKYARAADQPWLPVPTDPTEPE